MPMTWRTRAGRPSLTHVQVRHRYEASTIDDSPRACRKLTVRALADDQKAAHETLPWYIFRKEYRRQEPETLLSRADSLIGGRGTD